MASGTASGGGAPKGAAPATFVQRGAWGVPAPPKPGTGGLTGPQTKQIATTRAATPAAPAAAAPPPAAPAASNTVQPFLTPAQQNAKDTMNGNLGFSIGALNEALGTGLQTEQLGLAADQRSAAQATDNTNQSTAARGLFNSSIKGTDLADIATTQTLRDNLFTSNYNRLATDTATKIARLNFNNASGNNAYNDMAVANAQGVTPSLDQVAGAAAPATTAPAAPAQTASTGGFVKPVNPAMNQAFGAMNAAADKGTGASKPPKGQGGLTGPQTKQVATQKAYSWGTNAGWGA